MNCLLIVAAGKSTRFGGYPKAFSHINGKLIVENTVSLAKNYYDSIYIGVNHDTYGRFKNIINDATMFEIITGQGDAHSMLKCMNYVHKCNPNIDSVTVCWGDAVFVDSTPFEKIEKSDAQVSVACSLDHEPYAWFDVDKDNNILKSHFQKDEGIIQEGIHDQSLFKFDILFAIKYLNEYRESLGIPYDNDENKCGENEMKLLRSFEYLIASKYKPAKCVKIIPNKVMSFNTQAELNEINKILS